MDNRILLLTNKIMNYRVHIYNELNLLLKKHGLSLVVISNDIQDKSLPINFELHIIDFKNALEISSVINKTIKGIIIFLHLKDAIGFPILLIAKFKRIPIVYWNHGINLHTPNATFKNLIYRLFHHFCDAILLYSSNEIQYINAAYHNKTYIANNTLNFKTFPKIELSKEEIKNKYGLSGRNIVLMVTRLRSIKKVDDLISSSTFLIPQAHIIIVGADASEEQIVKMDEAQNISYLGAIYDDKKITEIFKMADIFCIPGHCGLSINQAFYWGLPVVTQDVIHAPEIIYLKDKVNGFIVEKGNVKAMAEKINQLLLDKNLYDSFSDSATATVHKEANLSMMLQGFIDALTHTGVIDEK